MIDSIVPYSPEEADALVIGIPYEHTASFGTGADEAPGKIKEILDEQLEFFDRFTRTIPAKDFKFGYIEYEDVKRFAPDHMVQEVSERLSKIEKFCVIVGGVHSVTIPALKALATKINPSDVTVVQIDAHFDLREDDSEYNEVDPSNYAHSAVMRRAFDYGYKSLPVGIRTMYSKEFEFARDNEIPFYEWGRLDTPLPTIEEVISAISTDNVYLTIDVDGFDPAYMPATGTPVPGGLTWEYGEALVREIMKSKNVLGADVVEVAPVEHSGQTEYNAAQLVYHILSLHMQKHQ